MARMSMPISLNSKGVFFVLPFSLEIFKKGDISTAQVAVSTEFEIKGHESGLVPVQILFCLKEKNAKKVISFSN